MAFLRVRKQEELEGYRKERQRRESTEKKEARD